VGDRAFTEGFNFVPLKPEEREGNNGKVREGYSKPRFEFREKEVLEFESILAVRFCLRSSQLESRELGLNVCLTKTLKLF